MTDEWKLYKAPSWATDWCPHCGWGAACADCRKALERDPDGELRLR